MLQSFCSSFWLIYERSFPKKTYALSLVQDKRWPWTKHGPDDFWVRSQSSLNRILHIRLLGSSSVCEWLLLVRSSHHLLHCAGVWGVRVSIDVYKKCFPKALRIRLLWVSSSVLFRNECRHKCSAFLLFICSFLFLLFLLLLDGIVLVFF